MLFLILLLVVAVAAFNIVATLVMVVKDKREDIAILRTLGAGPRNVLGDLHPAGRADRTRRHGAAAHCSAVLISVNLETLVHATRAPARHALPRCAASTS